MIQRTIEMQMAHQIFNPRLLITADPRKWVVGYDHNTNRARI